jgi:predicted branched-subunit amino acid permease
MGVPMWLTWSAATALGAALGAQVPASWQLDFAVPLMFLALADPLHP